MNPLWFQQKFRLFHHALLLITVYFLPVAYCMVVPITSSNFEAVLGSSELVFVNFYAEWCRYSQHLKPVFDEASNRFHDVGKIVFADVDSDREADIAQKFHVTKYPTLKIFRHGELVKREYRGQRSVDALVDFVKRQLEPAIIMFNSLSDLERTANRTKRNVAGYFVESAGPEYDNFMKIASGLRDDCQFYYGHGQAAQEKTSNGNRIEFWPQRSPDIEPYSGSIGDYNATKEWLTERCVPFVRELTFENAEELTEEGLPFLVLFRKPGDDLSERVFTDQVAKELYDQKGSINCLYADGLKFSHPLHHLGKTEADLPLIAIDSFRHMYLFPDIREIGVQGKLRQFVLDLHSGKLHREFHHGPDPTVAPSTDTGTQEIQQEVKSQQPPTSVFKQLKPSETRYSILQKDEL